jgi:hypothetical protein
VVFLLAYVAAMFVRSFVRQAGCTRVHVAAALAACV